MTKSAALRDGTPIVVRIITATDLEPLLKFYRELPYEDRKYLRIDVTNPKTVEQRLKLVQFGYHHRLAAFLGEEMIGEGALELPFEEWRRNQGELRLIVAAPFQRKGLGTILMRELYDLAKEKEVETVAIWMMKPQVAAQSLALKMGFHDQTVLPSYVRDQDGNMQDLVIMKGQIKDLLAAIEPVLTKAE
jgi:GNAT superfamily N-acetyltransferase